jgi:hypothetical protein
VQHIVKNRHADNWFHFIWEDLDASASLLAPRGGIYKYGGVFDSYHGNLVPGVIRYGANLKSQYAPRVSASYYHLPLQHAELSPDLGNLVAQTLEIDSADPNGKVEKFTFEVSSTYDNQSKSVTYTFARKPEDAIIAIGDIATTPVGQKIAQIFSPDIVPLSKVVDEKALAAMPDSLQKADFLLIGTDYSLSEHKISVETLEPPHGVKALIAILTDGFMPIGTGSILMLSP